MLNQAAKLDLTISIVSWNTRSLLRKCLDSIERCGSRYTFEVHVVDNASRDGSQNLVREEFPWVRLFVNPGNVGFATANNLSFSQARGRYWLLLNSDTELSHGAIDALIEFMDSKPRAGLATARLLNRDGSPQHCAQPAPSLLLTLLELSRLHKLLTVRVRGRLFLGPYWSYDQATQLGWTWGTALIARREAVDAAGPLREDFFMYGEDLEWCLRIRRQGWEVWYCPGAEVLHHSGGSSIGIWNENERLMARLDGSYKAIRMHKGQVYTRALLACTLLALVLSLAISRVLRRSTPSLGLLTRYYRRAIRMALAG